MFSGKDTANAAYPTQWALNPTAYQNVDSSQVDWAALAQQWIAMKEAAAIVAPPQTKPEEEGEAPMEVENSEPICESPSGSNSEWNATSNSWGNSWNQWGGWGWPNGPADSKMTGDPSMNMPPIMEDFTSDNTTPIPGYTTGTTQGPTFQHGYWTAPQIEQTSSSRSSSRNRDRRSKSKNRDNKSSRNRLPREKPPLLPPVIEPVVVPSPAMTATIDAAKRRQLPAWIREGLEKMEREKQKAIEREEELKAQEKAEIEKKKLEEEELARLKAEASGEPVMPAKSKFESESDGEELEDSQTEEPAEQPAVTIKEEPKEESGTKSPLIKKSKEEIMQEVMLAVRRSLTEILLEVTDAEIQTVSQEELARYIAAQASRLNAMKASKSKALASIATGLGLGAYESSDDSDEEPGDLSDQQLQDIIRRKRQEFEKTSREIEAEVRRAELRESGEDAATPLDTTPEKPRQTRSSATPPPIDSETPEKKQEVRHSKDKRTNHKGTDKVDSSKKLDAIPEEKPKRNNKYDKTPSPQKPNKSSKDSSNSSSSDSEDDSSSSSSNSSGSDHENEDSGSKKRKRRSSSSGESQNKSRKIKKEKSHKSSEKSYSKLKHDEYEKSEKSKSRKRDDYYYDKHKSRSRDYERSHKDKYRDDSEDDKPRKRSKRSRSISYESRSGRRRSRDRSEDRSRRRDRKSYDRDSYKRDRSYDRSRDYDKYDRYERSRDDRRDSHSRHRR